MKLPNPFGLFDMHGNVYEMCHDIYDKNSYQHASLNDPQGPAAGGNRVIRGGNWYYTASNARSASRDYVKPALRSYYYGFRYVRALGTPQVTGDPDRAAAEWALASGLRATILVDGQSTSVQVVNRGQLPARRFVVTRIDSASSTSITDADMAILHGIHSLEGVYIRGAELGDPSLAILAESKSIRSIKFSFAGSAKFTDAGMKRLAELPELHEFVLWKNYQQPPARITDVGVEALRGLPMTIVRLEGTSVTERTADLIARTWPKIVEVGLPPDALTTTACQKLAKLSALKRLNLWGVEIDAALLRRLAAFKVRPDFGLSLQYSDIQDSDLAELEWLKGNLTGLSIYNTSVSDAGVVHLTKLTKLRELNANGTKITDAGLSQLAKLSELTHLTIDGTDVTAAGVAKLQKALPKCEIEWDEPAKPSAK
jgi:hypothetical protein